MTMRVIDSEHDMEEAIKYTTELVKTLEGSKKLAFTFPSRGLSGIFLQNLAISFYNNDIPIVNGLSIDVYIPDGMDDDFDEDGTDYAEGAD